MAEPAKDKEKSQPIVIKKIVKGGGHHGGAWKVAYADFVTAMMAFFLLLWLLNVATDEQKNAISNYFDPTHPKVSKDTSGAGGVMGGLTMSPQGSMASNQNPLTPQQINKERQRGSERSSKVEVKSAKAKAREAEEAKRFKEAEQKLKEAIQKDAELAKLAKNLLIDMTPEGLRIQIVDQEGEPMFPSGSARMFPKMEALLQQITAIVLDMPNEVSIRGHTDSVKYSVGATYTNWELSADRANASRRVMLESKLPADRLNNVMGKADTEPLIAEDPSDPRNRRISIILLKEELTNPLPPEEEEAAPEGEASGTDAAPGEAIEGEEFEGEEDGTESGESSDAPPKRPIGTFQKTPGAVEFP